MTTKTNIFAELGKQGIVITRVFDAPRELVWKNWTDPERVKQWWGPKNFTAPEIKIDLRVGGSYLFCMRSPDGMDYWSTGVYREITMSKRIVYTDSFADEKGNKVPASHYGMGGDWPEALVVTVIFEERGKDKTVLTLRQEGIPEGEMRELSKTGWNESLDKFDESLKGMTIPNIIALPGKQEIVVTSVFDAPRDLVFKAYTDPKLVPRWWGPIRFVTMIDRMEVKPGGIWRFVQRDADGNEYAFHGVYHDIARPERLVYTFEFEGTPGQVLLETVIFEDLEGSTKVREISVFQSVEDRDGMLSSGMEEGMAETMDRLSELLGSLKK